MRRLGMLLACLLAACASRTPAATPATWKTSAVAPQPAPGMVVIPAPVGGAALYGTRATPNAVRGEPEAEALARTLVATATARGLTLEGDGRFAQLAEWVGGLVDDKGTPPPQSLFDFGIRHLGIAEDAPIVMTLAGGTAEERERYMIKALQSVPANIAYNRFAVVSSTRKGLTISVVVVGCSWLGLEPVPRSVALGQRVALRARLDSRFAKYEVVTTAPNGKVTENAQGVGNAVDISLALPTQGTWRVEILGTGPWGLTVLANFPLYVGTEPPAYVQVPRQDNGEDTVAETTPEAVSNRLFELLNSARREAGLPLLEPLPALAKVAEAHSKDMADNGFFGHVSPTTGDPSSRVRAAGMRYSIVAENVGMGRSAQAVHRALLDSPGHRGNMLNPKLTHVGIGVVFKPQDPRPDVYATQLFARVARPLDLARAPSELSNIINSSRRRAGGADLQREPLFDAIASAGATLYLQNPKVTKEQVLDSVVEELQKKAKAGAEVFKRIGKAETFLVAVPALEEANTFQAALDPTSRYIGIGVAQGTRPEAPENMIVVVLVVAWPSK